MACGCLCGCIHLYVGEGPSASSLNLGCSSDTSPYKADWQRCDWHLESYMHGWESLGYCFWYLSFYTGVAAWRAVKWVTTSITCQHPPSQRPSDRTSCCYTNPQRVTDNEVKLITRSVTNHLIFKLTRQPMPSWWTWGSVWGGAAYRSLNFAYVLVLRFTHPFRWAWSRENYAWRQPAERDPTASVPEADRVTRLSDDVCRRKLVVPLVVTILCSHALSFYYIMRLTSLRICRLQIVAPIL